MLKHVKLSYDLSTISAADHRGSETSCIATKIYKDDAGFPKSYCLENTRMHQLWWTNDQVDFSALGEELGMKVATVSSIVLPPGSVIPLHSDTFHKLRTEFPGEAGMMVRAVVYATPYDLGQMTQYIQDQIDVYISAGWQVGDGLMWDDQVPHVTVNGGMKDLCTVNISGFLI